MIVQSAPDSEPRFVIRMADHMAFAGRIARKFGNESFEPVEPRDVVLYIIDHHDAGWADLDAEARIDPATGLPYNLVKTPFEEIIKTSAASPAFNSKHHSYCGLLSSMHSWGLYNGRYGMSDHVLLDTIAADNRGVAEAMLDGELERQDRLKKALAEAEETAPLVDDAQVMQNYKQLQLFDTMALYFNCNHAQHRKTTTFTHVPKNAGEDVDIEITPRADGSYAMAPYPFAEDDLELSFAGRYMSPQSGIDRIDLSGLAEERQTVRLVAG